MNTPSPARNTPRRPIRSPSRPASSSRPPNAIRYALTTQARLDEEKPRSRWIEGSATFTTVASSTIISIPTHRTYRASQRDRLSLAFVMVASVIVMGIWSGDRRGRGNSSVPIGASTL